MYKIHIDKYQSFEWKRNSGKPKNSNTKGITAFKLQSSTFFRFLRPYPNLLPGIIFAPSCCSSLIKTNRKLPIMFTLCYGSNAFFPYYLYNCLLVFLLVNKKQYHYNFGAKHLQSMPCLRLPSLSNKCYMPSMRERHFWRYLFSWPAITGIAPSEHRGKKSRVVYPLPYWKA